MKNYQLLKELKEPSVIFKEDPDDPNNPEVLVKGVGRYRLRQVERNVQEKLADLNKHAARAQSHEDWKKIAWMLDHAAMNEMIRTIVSAKREIGGIKESFMLFPGTATEDLGKKVERLALLVKHRSEELEAANKRIAELEHQIKEPRRTKNSFQGSAGPFSKSDV